MSARLDGPVGASLNEAAYGPTFSWSGDWPGWFRRLGMVGAGVFVVLVLMGGVIARGWRTLAMFGLSALVVVLLFWWRSGHAPLLQRSGVVLSQDGRIACRDHWFYQTAPDARASAFMWKEWTAPIFASLEQMRSMRMRLQCDSGGHPIGFEYRLPAKARIAFLSRRVAAGGNRAVPQALKQTPLSKLTAQLYLQGDNQIVGEVSDPQTTWPSVVLRRLPEATSNDAQNQHSE
jgi:hypothetical protein